MKHQYYPALDGLRTIAVGIVLCAHGGVPYFRSGGVGVDIFLVLSGFLITTILTTEQARTGGISFRNFYARRFLRLAPALVMACALAAAGMMWLEGRFPGTEIALALSYTANWALAFYNFHLTWLNHCWSLSIEEQFYMIWPLIILGLESSIRSPQRKILLLVAEGKTNKEIAAEVFLSDKTVKNYVSSILSKLNLERRAQAAAYVAKLKTHPGGG